MKIQEVVGQNLQLFVPRPKSVTEVLKPQGPNLLWTSTAEQTANGWTSAWVEWCKTEMPQWVTSTGVLYRVGPGAKILNMNTDRDVHRIAKRYGLKIPSNNMSWEWMSQYPWDKIQKDFDAVNHVPKFRSNFLSMWDVESTVWFNQNHLNKIGQVSVDTGLGTNSSNKS